MFGEELIESAGCCIHLHDQARPTLRISRHRFAGPHAGVEHLPSNLRELLDGRRDFLCDNRAGVREHPETKAAQHGKADEADHDGDEGRDDAASDALDPLLR